MPQHPPTIKLHANRFESVTGQNFLLSDSKGEKAFCAFYQKNRKYLLDNIWKVSAVFSLVL